MSNATTLTTNDDYKLDDFRTIEQWLVEVRNHKQERINLVRLWLLNKFGSQTQLSKHLCCDRATVTRDVDKLLAMGELTSEHYQKKMCNSRKKPKQTGAKCTAPVENSSTPVQTAITRTQSGVTTSHTCPPSHSPTKTDAVQSGQPTVEVLPHVREPKFRTEEARAAWHHKQQLIEQIHAIDQQFGADWDEWHWLSDKHELHSLYTRAAQKSQRIDQSIERSLRESYG